MFNRKIIIATFSLAVPFLPLKVLSQNTLPQNSTENIAQAGYVGFAIENDEGIFEEVEILTLDDTRECVDRVPGKKIAFVSDNTPTADNRHRTNHGRFSPQGSRIFRRFGF